MSTTYISVALRREITSRANGCCEYCLIDTQHRAIDYVVDHIIAEKHGGPTQSDNLALSCYWCNSYKGSDISSVDWDNDGIIVPLYHPVRQKWSEHFQLDNAQIIPLTRTGRVTVFLLRLNAAERIAERQLLLELGMYPCEAHTS